MSSADKDDHLTPEDMESFVNLMSDKPSRATKVTVTRVSMGRAGKPVYEETKEEEEEEEAASDDCSTSTSEDQPTKPGPSAECNASQDVPAEVIASFLKASAENMKVDAEARRRACQRPESIPSVYDDAAFTYCKAVCKKITDYCDDDDVEAYSEEIDELFQKLGRFVQDRHAAKHVRLQAEYDTMMRRKRADYINQCTRCIGILTKGLVDTGDNFQDSAKAISNAITSLATNITVVMKLDNGE